jgi:hypothetical protein
MKQYLSYLEKVNQGLKEAKVRSGLSTFCLWIDYLWCAFRYGTLIKQYVYSEYWRLSSHVRNESLTYPRIEKLIDKYNPHQHTHLLQNKEEFNTLFSDFIHHEWLFVPSCDQDAFELFLKKHDSIFIKPAKGEDGEGIRKFTLSDNPGTDIKTLFEKLKSENAIIEQCIVQDPRMTFDTKSVNTIKVTTATDSHGVVHVMKSMLRIGIGDSVIDNLATGGAIYDIDIEHGFVNSHGYSKYGEKLVYHPGTNIVVMGFKIPHWDEVIACAKNAAQKVPQLRIIGWDIAITPEGVDLIEGNHNPDYLPIEYGSTGFYKKFKMVLNNK